MSRTKTEQTGFPHEEYMVSDFETGETVGYIEKIQEGHWEATRVSDGIKKTFFSKGAAELWLDDPSIRLIEFI